ARILPDNPQEACWRPEFSAPADRAGASRGPQRFSKPDAGTAILNLWPTASDCHRLMDRRGRASRRLFPERAVPQNLFDHLALMPLNKADDLHLAPTFGTNQRVHLVNLFEQS